MNVAIGQRLERDSKLKKGNSIPSTTLAGTRGKMSRRFEPRDYGWSPSVLPSRILIANGARTYYNVCSSNGRFIPDMIGLYVDGACRGIGTPSERGGIGVHFGPRSRYNRSSPLPEDMEPTSQRAELLAAISAIETIAYQISKVTDIDTFVIVSDSQYLVNGITGYIYQWKRNGWITSMGGPVKNQDLWSYLDFLLTRLLDLEELNIMFWKCDRSENEEADALARMAVE